MSQYECTKKLGNQHTICGEDCDGRIINFESSIFRTPANTNVKRLIPRLKESICLYSNLEPLMKELVSVDAPSWLYFGGVDGIQRIYPSAGRQRGLKGGDKLLGGCRQYDPRKRPWFIGASTRPKDIVLVIDVSKSMGDPIDELETLTRWDVTREAVHSMLGTLASFDYVNIVTFSSVAYRLGTNSSLLQGTKENLDHLREKMEKQFPSGSTNFDAAFYEAFDILTKACDEGTKHKQACSKCHKVILFLTDGRDTTFPRGESITPSDMLERIESYQKKLAKETSKRASIFTFSMGESADDSIPRQIACANNGSWSFIGADTDPITAMNSYYHFLTNYDQRSSPVWINPYKDDGGLGIVTTVAKPVYSQGTEDLDGVFLGVAAHDVFLRDLEAPGMSPDAVLEELFQRSQPCETQPQSPCQLQVHRNAHADNAVCVDPISSDSSKTNIEQQQLSENHCYRGPAKYYKLFTEKESWDEAVAACRDDKGRLVVIQNEKELALIAGISSPDASWIGAQRNLKTLTMEWIDSEIPSTNLKKGSHYWGIGEPNNSEGIENCVHIDRRGVNGNLNDEECAKRLSFICEYTSDKQCEYTVTVPKKGYFYIPPLDKCVHEEESLANAGPHPLVDTWSNEEIMCPLGKPLESADVICCPRCSLTLRKSSEK